MLSYYLQLAWLSVRRTPVMSLLMILTLAVGVAVSMTMLTLQHVMSTNGLAAKNDTLYALQIDNASAGDGGTSSGNKLTNGLPYLLSYRTVTTLLRSDIPLHQVAMHRWAAALSLENNQVRPSKELVRVTSRDFFALFGVPFIYGQVWDKSADNDARYQVVIDRTMNQRLFNGENSVWPQPATGWSPYQVVGVVEDFNPLPSVAGSDAGCFWGQCQYLSALWLTSALQMMPYGSMTYSSSQPSTPAAKALDTGAAVRADPAGALFLDAVLGGITGCRY
ncbi:MAG: ABC transporter permease [Shewanella fodinae]|nr:ABC transporter permease [Shewanella fodinae]